MKEALYESIRPLLFRCDAEKVHHVAMTAIAKGFMRGTPYSNPCLEKTLFGVTFPNPVGLAAGFDKDGLALNHWQSFGFGFIEVGTVTRHPQPGNPKPRLFRLPEHKAVINRMGFNNAGADALLARLQSAQPGIPLGINIGKSKITPLEEAHEDYSYSFRLLLEHGDYFAINVSSPNTEGLRSLQDRESLTKIISEIKTIDDTKSLFVKIAPDLTESALDEILQVASDLQLTGLIATNTTISRDMLPTDPQIQGGLSGAPVKEKSLAVLKYLKSNAPPSLHLIGVGGILNPLDAQERLESGADLIQIYSGWIYNRPSFPAEIARHLAEHSLPKSVN
ncbi:dihydroorotate dehydrogenase (quinone) [bacterium]|nr:dihydroorotate dehydrogenase (quinone) [bacterium]